MTHKIEFSIGIFEIKIVFFVIKENKKSEKNYKVNLLSNKWPYPISNQKTFESKAIPISN